MFSQWFHKVQPHAEPPDMSPLAPAVGINGHPHVALDAESFIYQIQASEPLPSVDLSRTLARHLLSSAAHRTFVNFMSRHFHHMVMVYRLGVVDFAVLLFLPQSDVRTGLSFFLLPCTLSVFTSVFFMSVDVFKLLVQCYEFWFLVIINASNWILLATILPDIRLIICWAAWLSYQTVITIDANYRTYPTALVSTLVSAPLVLAIAGLVAAQYVRDGNYYDVYVMTFRISDAGDLITFTTSTLVFFLVKMLILKRIRMHRTFEGFYSIPCVVIKSRLRLEAFDPHGLARRRQGVVSPTTHRNPRHNDRQQLLVCTPPMTHLDAFRTVLPHRLWKRAAQWSTFRCRILRGLFYSVGGAGLLLLTCNTVTAFQQDWEANTVNPHNLPRQFVAATRTIQALSVLSSICSVIFCGGFALFYQRDLLRLLSRNFDFGFCVAQMLAFIVCHCDLMAWNFERTVTLLTWAMWIVWALTLDAATPIIKSRIFCFRKRWATPVLANSIVGAAAVGLFILFMPGLGFHDRVLWSFDFWSNATFVIHTQSVLLGRVVTIHLWCTRHAFLLWTRRDDELNFIQGSVEYLSPHSHFPSARKQTAVVTSGQSDRR